MPIFVGKTIATKIKLHNGVGKRCECMKSRFLLEIEEIGVRYRSHRTNCGAIWFCHIPFCPEVKGMPSFEWLKFKEGKTSGIPQKFQEFPNPFCLVSQKRMHDICMLLDARMILEWAFHSVNLAPAKRPK